jgi:hypothetical protein
MVFLNVRVLIFPVGKLKNFNGFLGEVALAAITS